MKREEKYSRNDNKSKNNKLIIGFIFLFSVICFFVSLWMVNEFWKNIFFTLGMELGPLGLLMLFLDSFQIRTKDEELLNNIDRRISTNILPVFESKLEEVLNNYGFTSDVTRTVGYGGMYTEGTKIIRQAHNRLLIIQNTSSLIFGARKGVQEEDDFYDALVEWISDFNENPNKVECLHYYNYTSTMKEIEDLNKQSKFSPEKLIENIKKYKTIEERSNGKFRFAHITSPFSGPIAIGDNMFVIWIGGEDKYTSISFTNKKFADKLFEICKGMIGRNQPNSEDLIIEFALDKKNAVAE